MEGTGDPEAGFTRKKKITGIKAWPEDDQPREKLVLKGINALSDAELLAIVIRTGHHPQTALDLAKKLLSGVQNDLQQLSRLSAGDFMKIRGMGKVKAVSILAAMELGRRRQAGTPLSRPGIHSSADAAMLLKPKLADLRHEVFVVLFLSQRHHVIHYEQISSGGIAGTVADPKVIMRKALEHDAVKLILCHNHPSGNLQPSPEDLKLTRKLAEAAQLLDMGILDHLIVSTQGYFSFADEGLL